MALTLRDVPPLLPDGEEARRWAEQELSDPAYRAAEPTGIDRLARDLAQWFADLVDIDPGGGLGQVAAIALVVVVALVVVGAFLVWGLPRMTAHTRTAAELFGADLATVTAADHRRAAREAAARGDWDAAIVARVRAIARSLAERLVVEAPPGATVHAFADRASRAFPRHADDLGRAARSFDDVRYLRRPGTAEAYAEVESLDRDLESERPVHDGALV